jgi:hypothetical protein
MNKEQSLLLAVRHQLSVLGYSEAVIDWAEPKISNFCALCIDGADHQTNYLNAVKQDIVKASMPTVESSKYSCYMYINNPSAAPLPSHYDVSNLGDIASWEHYKNSDHGFLFDTFETESDWQTALVEKDVVVLKSIYDEVVKFAVTKPVPEEVVSFIKNTPAYIATLNWSALEYNGIVDAYCDQDVSEYVVYTV